MGSATHQLVNYKVNRLVAAGRHQLMRAFFIRFAPPDVEKIYALPVRDDELNPARFQNDSADWFPGRFPQADVDLTAAGIGEVESVRRSRCLCFPIQLCADPAGEQERG